jgi:PIN domain nuclease of toxin-antitoxin system
VIDGVLADTQAVLLWLWDDPRLPAAARELIEDGGVPVFVSAASVWETAIKVSTGKIGPPTDDLPAELARQGFDLIPIDPADAWAVRELPAHHADPFDRLIIAQARARRLPVVTGDRAFDAYDVEVLW